MKKAFPITALVMFALAACQGNASSNKTQIYIYRASNIGFAAHPVVLVDGQAVGKSKSYGYLSVDVSPGEHTVSSDAPGKPSVTVVAGPGRKVYVRESMRGAPSLDQVPESVAVNDMDGVM